MQSATHGFVSRKAKIAALLAVVMAVTVGSAYAQRPQQRSLAAEAEDQANQGTIDGNVGNVMAQALTLYDAMDYAGALAKLGTLRVDRLSPYERARIEGIYFQIAYEQDDMTKAREHLENMIASGGLNEQEVSAARYQAAQLYLAEEKWKEGAAALEEWFKTAVNPNSEAYYLLAAAYFQMEDFDKALPPAEKSVELMTRPNANWITLLLAVYGEREEHEKAIPLLERLIVLQPEEKRWWLALSMRHSLMEDQQSALAIMDLANLAGVLDHQDEIMRLAELADFNDIPYRCAKIITDGIAAKTITPNEKIFDRNATCWMRAREFDKAIPPLTQAAELAETGNMFVRLAEVETQRQQWEAVISAIDRALAKGKVDDIPKANVLKGMALYRLDKPQEAVPFLQRARESTQQSTRQMAIGYLQMIEAGL